jgi:hypothetical protein
MLSWNQSFKATMIVSFLGSSLRTTAMHLAGYRDRDLTFWQQFWAWGIAAVVAEGMFLVMRRVLLPGNPLDRRRRKRVGGGEDHRSRLRSED